LSSIGSVEMVFCGSSSNSAFSSSSPCNLQAVGPGDSKSYVGGDGASARVSVLCKRRRCGGGGVKQPLLSQTFVPANSSPKLSQGLLLKTPNGAPRGHRSTLSGWFRDKFALSRGFVSRMGSCCEWNVFIMVRVQVSILSCALGKPLVVVFCTTKQY
jgi:hypothetical protein